MVSEPHTLYILTVGSNAAGQRETNLANMNRLIISLAIFSGLGLIGCQQTGKQDNNTKKIEFNQSLADELRSMAEIDQLAANFPQGMYKQWTKEHGRNFKTVCLRHIKCVLKKFLVNLDTQAMTWSERKAQITFG